MPLDSRIESIKNLENKNQTPGSKKALINPVGG